MLLDNKGRNVVTMRRINDSDDDEDDDYEDDGDDDNVDVKQMKMK